MDNTEALHLACWITDGVCGRKLELDHFLWQHGIGICFLPKTHLRSGEAFRLGNYICHLTDRLTEGGGTAILALPVQGRKHGKATAIQVIMTNKSVKIMAF
jgi:hypothetical protein